MASIEQLVVKLRQKKREATNLRKKTEKQLKDAKYLERRSSSGLHSIDRKIESDREDVVDISEELTQKTAQLESIERLLVAAQERLTREKEEITQTEQEVEFAENPEEKQYAETRLRTIQNNIQELESEIKTCKKNWIYCNYWSDI